MLPDFVRSGSRPTRWSWDLVRFGSKSTRFSPDLARYGSRSTRFSLDPVRFGSKSTRFSSDLTRFSSDPSRIGSERSRFDRNRVDSARIESIPIRVDPVPRTVGRIPGEPRRWRGEPGRLRGRRSPFDEDPDRRVENRDRSVASGPRSGRRRAGSLASPSNFAESGAMARGADAARGRSRRLRREPAPSSRGGVASPRGGSTPSGSGSFLALPRREGAEPLRARPRRSRRARREARRRETRSGAGAVSAPPRARRRSLPVAHPSPSSSPTTSARTDSSTASNGSARTRSSPLATVTSRYPALVQR